MLKKGLLFTFIILFSTLTQAQKKAKIKGDKNVTAQETPINSFNKILVGEDFFIDIIVGESAAVFIEADDNLHDVIQFNVADSVLSFKTTKKITSSKKLSIKVIYTNSLKEIETVDGGEISSLTSIDLDDITVKSSGTSKVFLNVKSQNFKLTSTDRSRVKLNVTSINNSLVTFTATLLLSSESISQFTETNSLPSIFEELLALTFSLSKLPRTFASVRW